jgi:hypothetical protein
VKRKNAILLGVAVIVVSLILGATVLREPIATAASPIASVFVTNTTANPVPVQQQGTAPVAVQGTAQVTGTLSAHPLAPVSPWHAMVTVDSAAKTVVGPSEPGGAINLTSMTVMPLSGTVDTIFLQEVRVDSSSSDCSQMVESRGNIWFGKGIAGPFNVTFPSPLQVQTPSTAQRVCLVVGITGSSVPILNASGFFGR